MWNNLKNYLIRPALYAPGTHTIWEDVHVSAGMLKAHLAPDTDAASRSIAFIDRSVAWISALAPTPTYRDLLDLGCGPGLYAERFANRGYQVTGIDFSGRSIAYAREQTERKGSGIAYHKQDYLSMEYTEQFDLITLIYCDYAAMPKSNRMQLLTRIYCALRPGGKLLFDVFTPRMRSEENQSWYYTEDADFWSDVPHLCLSSVYQYDDEDQTELRQTVVCSADAIKCFNVWDHFFTRNKLLYEVLPAGFCDYALYADVAGKKYVDDAVSDTICVILSK